MPLEEEVVKVRVLLKPALSPQEPGESPAVPEESPVRAVPEEPSPPAEAPGAKGPPGDVAQTEEPAPVPFSVRFTSKPSRAEVKLEGKLLGYTPKARASNLSPDREYRFTARLPGYRLFEGSFRGSGKPEVEVEIKLVKESARESPRERERERARQSRVAAVRAKGKLACSSNPAGADVIVDGKPTGRQTPIPIAKPLELPVGTHKVVFRLGGKQSKPQSVVIPENDVVTLRNVAVE